MDNCAIRIIGDKLRIPIGFVTFIKANTKCVISAAPLPAYIRPSRPGNFPFLPINLEEDYVQQKILTGREEEEIVGNSAKSIYRYLYKIVSDRPSNQLVRNCS